MQSYDMPLFILVLLYLPRALVLTTLPRARKLNKLNTYQLLSQIQNYLIIVAKIIVYLTDIYYFLLLVLSFLNYASDTSIYYDQSI